MTTLTEETTHRHTFAVIVHPDAGKSMLTETLALHVHIINGAGAIHGKASRKSIVSDWMDMEKDHDISIASSAPRFKYQPKGHDGESYMINLIDTPGHTDFSEDTYRMFTVVDAAVMPVDGAKGLEPQTLKLPRVCKSSGIPIVTVINKWGRPGKAPLELMDEIIAEIGLQPTPLCRPAGKADDSCGLLERGEDGETKQFIGPGHTAGGATITAERHLTPDETVAEQDDAWEIAAEESELLSADSAGYDQEMYLAGNTSLVIFASVMLNWGVYQILGTLCELAPTPGARESDPAAVATAAASGQGTTVEKREPMGDFSDAVFRTQAGMDTHHRDELALMRVVFSKFDHSMRVMYVQSRRSFFTKHALTVFGRTRSTVETVYPDDTVGPVNADSLAPGDTIYEGYKVRFGPIPQLASKHFRTLRAESLDKYKQLRKAIDQLDTRDMVQVLRNDARDDAAPVTAAAGLM